MYRIAIIDDKPDFRDTIRSRLTLLAPAGWSVLANEPLAELSDYPAWLGENEVAVLLLDERLTDEPLQGGGQAGYEGHELLAFLRERMAEFPIYIVTAQKRPEELERAEAAADDIVEKKALFERIEVLLPRFIRHGMKWYDLNQERLTRLSHLAALSATGQAMPEDVKELDALRLTMAIGEPVSASRVEVLNKLEGALGLLRAAIEKACQGGANE